MRLSYLKKKKKNQSYTEDGPTNEKMAGLKHIDPPTDQSNLNLQFS